MFVHLRLHSEFSIVDGAVRIPAAVKAAAAAGQGALALTDLNNMFGAVKFYKKARAAGVKPLLGAEVMLKDWPGATRDPAAAHGPNAQAAPKILLLAQNDRGYLNLCEGHVIAIQESRQFCEKRTRLRSKGLFPRRASDQSNNAL